MYNEHWKEPLLKLSVHELKTAQSFIVELIQTLEMLQEAKVEPIVIFPPEKNINIDERRSDKRFDIEIEGVCSVVTSKNLQERCDFLVSSADDFFVEPIAMKEILALLG